MRVRVLTFGVLRERLGVSEETVELAEMFPDDLALHGREGAR
jgi:molybdopterin converting factor small subunit